MADANINTQDDVYGNIFDSFVDDLDLDDDEEDDGNVENASSSSLNIESSDLKRENTMTLMEMAKVLESTAIEKGVVSADKVKKARRASVAASKASTQKKEQEAKEREDILAAAATVRRERMNAKQSSLDGTITSSPDAKLKKKRKSKKKTKKHRHRGSLVSEQKDKERIRQERREKMLERQEERRAKISRTELEQSTQDMARNDSQHQDMAASPNKAEVENGESKSKSPLEITTAAYASTLSPPVKLNESRTEAKIDALADEIYGDDEFQDEDIKIAQNKDSNSVEGRENAEAGMIDDDSDSGGTDSYDNDDFADLPDQETEGTLASERIILNHGKDSSLDAQYAPSSQSKVPSISGSRMEGRGFEVTRHDIEANADSFSPWESLLLQDSLQESNNGNKKLTDNERRCLRQASEARQVFSRLISISKARGVSMSNIKVLDNYGKMVNAKSLKNEIDKGVVAYNAVMMRLQGNSSTKVSKSSRGRKMLHLVDIVDRPRAQQLNFLFDNCRNRNPCWSKVNNDRSLSVSGSPKVLCSQVGWKKSKDSTEASQKAVERWTFGEMESALLALPVSAGSSVKEHTQCLCEMLKLLERCFRAGGAITSAILIDGQPSRNKTEEHELTPLTVTRSELHSLSAMADRVEYLESKFASSYLASLRELFLSSCKRTAIGHLKDQSDESSDQSRKVPFLPKISGASDSLNAKILSLKEKIKTLEFAIQSQSSRPAALLTERLGIARASRYDYLSSESWDEKKLLLQNVLDFLCNVLEDSESAGGFAKKTLIERLKHYDLTDGGWIRKKEFEHAIEDGIGYACNSSISSGDGADKNHNSGDAKFVTGKNSFSMNEVVESLLPFLDPTGRGHIEYKPLLQYLEVRVGLSLGSSESREMVSIRNSLSQLMKKKAREEERARSQWSHLPALLCCKWDDLELTNRRNNCWVKQLYEDPSMLILPPEKDDMGNMNPEYLDTNALYGIGSEVCVQTSTLYVPKWSVNWLSTYIIGSPTRIGKRSRKKEVVWNKLPLLTLTSDGSCGLRCIAKPSKNVDTSTATEVFLGGVTWAHMLAALYHCREDFLLRPPSRFLSRGTRQDLLRRRRLENMLAVHKETKIVQKNNVRKGESIIVKSKQSDEEHGVDFVTRMERKLRATRIKLEQARQREYKKDRDAARGKSAKSWEQVQESFFKRLSGESPKRARQEQSIGQQNARRKVSGKMKLERRSAMAFASLCKRARDAFAEYDIEGSGWIEVTDLSSVLNRLQHVAPRGIKLMDWQEESAGLAEGSQAPILEWHDLVVKELERDGSISQSHFIDWWVSQCPACIPLRDCPTETGISVRRVALDRNDAKWLFNQCPDDLAHLPAEFSSGNIPMVCSPCWDEYRRLEFLQALGDREKEASRVHGQELQQLKMRQEPVNELWTGDFASDVATKTIIPAHTESTTKDLIELPDGV